MKTLSPDLRNHLARTVLEARKVAEAGAHLALEALAVHHHEPFGTMSKHDRDLRNRLRAHGRQLGDERDSQRGDQTISRLKHECAFEHWHRMLFARFLAENGLLLHPEHSVSVSLDECRELARAANEDAWVMASQFAQKMLPRLFREDDPVLSVKLPPESRQALERLVSGLPAEVFAADDSLGWTYQFWQTERKDEVNDKGGPIGADELPAVTQLFTEHYMVLFLLHNTIGAWHAGRVLSRRPDLSTAAADESTLRVAMALPDYDFDYLRFVRDGNDPWRPGAGIFEKWPAQAKDLTVLDPCGGSGHFLVSAFDLLVRLRMFEEALDLETAIKGVLTENLFGLELEPRCTQIGAFAVTLRAWKLLGRPADLPPLQIACSGLAAGVPRKDWLALAEGNSLLKEGMGRLYDLFEQAPTLGSLLDPDRMLKDDIFSAKLNQLEPLLDKALASSSDAVAQEAGLAASGMVDAVRILRRSYTLVITNPPYLGRARQSKELIDYADEYESEAKKDLATVFLSRSLRWCGDSGTVAFVTPQNWLFLTSYQKLRETLLKYRTWNAVVRLGPGAFETISGEVVQAALITLSAWPPAADNRFLGIDVSNQRGERPIPPSAKAALLRQEAGSGRDLAVTTNQTSQRRNPDSVISISELGSSVLLGAKAYAVQGMGTGDLPRFLRNWWELGSIDTDWDFFQTTPTQKGFSGYTGAIHWQSGNGPLAEIPTARKGLQIVGKQGVAIAVTGSLDWAYFIGSRFDCTIGAILPQLTSDLPPLAAFVSDERFVAEVRKIDQCLSVTEANFLKVPFDIEHWKRIAAELFPKGLPSPQSNDPTQWLFHGHPAGMLEAGDARDPNPIDLLQVAVARIAGYRWPAELHPGMHLDAKSRAWISRCADLTAFADDDGIVPINPMHGEPGAAERVRQLLEAVYREAGLPFSQATIAELIGATGSDARSLHDWLVNDYFRQHYPLFDHRPFTWHLWDGRRDGFNALVHYHRLAAPGGAGRKLLEKLTHSYLGDWIDRQKAEQREGRDGADGRLAAAQSLRLELEKILEGEPPYDLFIRWKSLAEQPIGWDPDVNDGVRLNIRPFLKAKDMGRKGAGLLRDKPNIKWRKDRGVEAQSLRPKNSFPWFWACDPESNRDHLRDFAGGREYTGYRWNDLHYSIATKRRARSETTAGSRA